jgi:hypothetical protein
MCENKKKNKCYLYSYTSTCEKLETLPNRHDLPEILLKMALNTITLTP